MYNASEEFGDGSANPAKKTFSFPGTGARTAAVVEKAQELTMEDLGQRQCWLPSGIRDGDVSICFPAEQCTS